MEVKRKKDNKWIIQKNISSKKFFDSYIESLSKQQNKLDKTELLKKLKEKNTYKGRSKTGNANTLGVRFSQICFYMLGYKEELKQKFIPSISTQMFRNKKTDLKTSSLINLFSMQYPNPYSNTPNNFKIFMGRLIIKLLLDKNIENKLYIDEFIWFLPFIESINSKQYDYLINNILSFRKLTYEEKVEKFKSIKNYDDIFSNCMHEIKYYFCKIYEEFGVLDLIEDREHNSGNLISFKHGKGNTFRRDNIKGNKHSGYIKLNSEIIEKAQILSNNYSTFEIPKTESDFTNLYDWKKQLYQYNMINYFATLDVHNQILEDLSEICESVVYESIHGGDDGKSFEKALKPAFELFRENIQVVIYSGAGNTDLLCTFKMANKNELRVNVDAKKRKRGYTELNPYAINEHLIKHNSEYAIIVAPNFRKAARRYSQNNEIVLLKSETLATYLSYECSSSNDGLASYEVINDIINEHKGEDISDYIEDYVIEKYQIQYTE